ncbi:MAG: DUF1549 domain-containing protein, partial [Planctomycetota bacterium]|nr:DUF1549 domain-containing protein [Planctomycetota bacterium]
GQRIKPDEPYYRIIRDWIAGGAELHLDVPRVAKIEITPRNPVLQKPAQRQAMRVVATYADGSTRDVTHEAFITSGNTEVAEADRTSALTAVRRGEAPVLARYEGAYAATTLTVMGDREGFQWEQPPTWGRVDELVAAKWQRMKIRPSQLCSDAEFIRRIYLDLAGLPPTAEQVRAFLDDPRDARQKRDELVDQLIGSEDFIEYWTNKWADLLQVNSKFLGRQGAVAFRKWIRDEVAGNTPYDQFARKILTAGGSNRENPAASYYKVLRDPVDIMENTTHLFLAIRFNCNKCHDHPFERWTQNQYYETAAYFARVGLKKDPASGEQKIRGTAVEGAKPLYEVVFDKPQGEVVHDRTKVVTPPEFPFECKFEASDEAPRRQQLAAWITSPDNPYFARSYVNRLWGYLFGVGIIEPIDDIRAGNPATNPELLDYLTGQFVQSGFDVRQMFALICKSRTYQLSFQSNRWNEDDRLNYSHALPRRLPAEVLYDTVHRVTGSISKLPGVPPGTRAAALPDSGIKLPSGFLDTMGRPARQSSCECERSSGLELGPVMALISGPTVAAAIGDPHNEIAKLVAEISDDRQLINTLVLRILNRPATDAEVDATLKALAAIDTDHARLVDGLNRLEAQLAPVLAAEEAERQKRIDEARARLAAYLKQHAARLAELEKQRQEKVAQAQRALEEYQQRLPATLAKWEHLADTLVSWTPLDPAQLSATNNAKLVKEPDLSVVASGPNGKGTYTFVARSELSAITGVKLELISDERLPRKGPGRAPNGNFVLSEFRAELAPETEPQKKTPVQLQNAQADFSQKNYDVKTAIDNKKAPFNNGWATAPKIGQNRTAVFETAEDTGTGPVLLTFSLDQKYADGQHSIGRFRISVTTAPRPLTLVGMPKKITDILSIAADQRNDQQRQELMNYYRQIDGELKNLQQAVTEAQKPLSPDAVHRQHQQRVKDAEQPIPLDPKLVALRKEVGISQQQLNNKRLTVAQDLAWALINSPAFLFNH